MSGYLPFTKAERRGPSDADPELLARLDRIALLLVALLGVELWKLLGIDIFAVGLLVVAGLVFGFASLWGKSVIGLLFERGV